MALRTSSRAANAEVLALCVNLNQVVDCLLVGRNVSAPERDFVEIDFSDSTGVSLTWSGRVGVDVSALGALEG